MEGLDRAVAQKLSIREISAETRVEAAQFVDEHPELLDASDAMGVRALVLAAVKDDERPTVSDFQSAVLSEAVGRWNRAHSADA